MKINIFFLVLSIFSFHLRYIQTGSGQSLTRVQQEPFSSLIRLSFLFTYVSHIDIFFKERLQATFLHAAETGNLGAVIFLLACNINVNTRGQFQETALHRAAGRGHSDMVRILLKCGADKTLRDAFYNRADAYANRYPTILQILINHRQDHSPEQS